MARGVDSAMPLASKNATSAPFDLADAMPLDVVRDRDHAAALAEFSSLAPGDVVILTIDGQGATHEQAEYAVDMALEADPSRDAAPFIVVPYGMLGRLRALARAAGCAEAARWMVEAPPMERVDFEVQLPAQARAWWAWFDREDVSDDELTQILSEQEEIGPEEIGELLAERARRRELRGDPLLVDVAPRGAQ